MQNNDATGSKNGVRGEKFVVFCERGFRTQTGVLRSRRGCAHEAFRKLLILDIKQTFLLEENYMNAPGIPQSIRTALDS
ncbi:hypothetical protein Cpar_0314 [Chlorobaculum parvum NCIB 8327]|uniref:Uncharacterized protein n=1 Tax=Chlorobaculum parvum (strain DSM 263 / NCIMB 8327) TaxID=517417 RepID=B3QKV1_CHLP8|nr:hypothetical protein Cpar_0314 [Chlorobaculum parvum NCIB 8327]